MNNNQRNLKSTTGGVQKKTVYMREKVHKYLHSRGGFSNTWWPLWESRAPSNTLQAADKKAQTSLRVYLRI